MPKSAIQCLPMALLDSKYPATMGATGLPHRTSTKLIIVFGSYQSKPQHKKMISIDPYVEVGRYALAGLAFAPPC
eukprot:3229305-Amphidinium_carterae.1